MWRLNAFWKVISPVPVILKRFLALEFVLTFGILHAVLNATLLAALHRQDTYGAVWAIVRFVLPSYRAFIGLQRYGFVDKKPKPAGRISETGQLVEQWPYALEHHIYYGLTEGAEAAPVNTTAGLS